MDAPTTQADPAPVAQTFFMDAALKEKTRLDAIVTLVDAKHIVRSKCCAVHALVCTLLGLVAAG